MVVLKCVSFLPAMRIPYSPSIRVRIAACYGGATYAVKSAEAVAAVAASEERRA